MNDNKEIFEGTEQAYTDLMETVEENAISLTKKVRELQEEMIAANKRFSEALEPIFSTNSLKLKEFWGASEDGKE